VPSIDLPEEQAILLFQSVRELLMNVVKHAKTTEASLTLDLTDDNWFTVTVADRGEGVPRGRCHWYADHIRSRGDSIIVALAIVAAPYRRILRNRNSAS
jgi:nitrate/nitrite-specific signal transduction histidine kinase